jgi:hypothetical protein
MKLLNKLILLISAVALSVSCTTVSSSKIQSKNIYSTHNPSAYKVVGSITIKKLYFDWLASESKFTKTAENLLHSKVPDAIYDLEGDTCWITNFDIKHHSPKCLGFCTELKFDIIVLKQ